MARTIRTMASRSSGGEPRKPSRSAAPLRASKLRQHFRFVHVRRQQARILEDFGLHAAEADDHDGSPFRIVAPPDDQLDARRAHRLDQNAVEREAWPAASDIVLELRPSLLERGLVAKADDHAASIALVRKLRGLRLDDDRIADPCRDRGGLRGRRRERALRKRNADRARGRAWRAIPGSRPQGRRTSRCWLVAASGKRKPRRSSAQHARARGRRAPRMGNRGRSARAGDRHSRAERRRLRPGQRRRLASSAEVLRSPRGSGEISVSPSPRRSG